jgi:FtsP/CotA-like multicopper oxidase with cupredoxin domain
VTVARTEVIRPSVEADRQRRILLAAVASVALACAALVSMTAAPRIRAATEDTNNIGLVCTTSPGTSPHFSLTTRSGEINLPDGTTAFMFGYSEGSQPFQHPGPVLCVNEGDTVTIVLHNTLSRRVSIAFPGQHDVLANGVPAQPEVDGGGRITSFTTSAAPTTGTVTYAFVADKPGTYLYESGTDPETQVRLGLFGALIVRPSAGAAFAYDRPDSEFNSDTEFLMLLSEIDPYLNAAVQGNRTFNFNTYHPRYWLVNGRGFPDSIADNFAAWLPTQPYGALAPIHPNDKYLADGTTLNPSPQNPLPSLSRFLSAGTEDYPFHPHGNNGRVIGRDGAPLEGPSGEDVSFEKFAVNIGPGQTWDVLFSWRDNEAYDPDSNPIPVTEPNLQDLEVGMFYSGSAYLGDTNPMPPGIQTLNECGEFYIIAHNHALYQMTSWGVNMTGPITYTRIDPPLPNSCPS